jgi:hypothetical protein
MAAAKKSEAAKGLGEMAYDAFRKEAKGAPAWSALDEQTAAAWCAAAQAVLTATYERKAPA